jgi:hypothetical protein
VPSFHDRVRAAASLSQVFKNAPQDQRKTVFATQVGENPKNGICLTGLSLVMESLDIVVSF